MPSYLKVQSVAKKMLTCEDEGLQRVIRQTMHTISALVGSTLGPGGRQVLIERQEYAMPPVVTKDGVTVFRSLGFRDPTAQTIMESARDAATRTATEAGDGTTTATILAEAIVANTIAFCNQNPSQSPQAVVRQLQSYFNNTIEPTLRGIAYNYPCNLESEAGKTLTYAVAKTSANGDTELADAVLKCFDLVGDDGNVTIVDSSGPTGYFVDRIEGYPITNMGYERSCGPFYPKFINDPASQRILLEDCYVVIWNGRIQEPLQLANLMEKIGEMWNVNRNTETPHPHNVVIVAHHFSEQVQAALAINFESPATINVVPFLSPFEATDPGQQGFMEDLVAVTGQSHLFDPLSDNMDTIPLSALGKIKNFECSRGRANFIGDFTEHEINILERVDQLKTQLKAETTGKLEKDSLQQRIGKLTGGIARLKVIGPSTGEIRERKDRADDAIRAIQGAIKHGCLPAGGYGLMSCIHQLRTSNIDVAEYTLQVHPSWMFWKGTSIIDAPSVLFDVLIPSLEAPIRRLYSNVGMNEQETDSVLQTLEENASSQIPTIFNALSREWSDAPSEGLMDSLPAVLEAVRNSLSIASLLGTLGGTVVFHRSEDMEMAEARHARQFDPDKQEHD